MVQLRSEVPATLVEGNPETLKLRAAILSRAADIENDGERLLYVYHQGMPWPKGEADLGVFTVDSLSAKLDMPQEEVLEWLSHLQVEGYVQKVGKLNAFVPSEDGRKLYVKCYRLGPLGTAWLRAWYQGRAL